MGTLSWRDGGAAAMTVLGRRLECATYGPAPEAAPTVVMLHEGLGCLELWWDFPRRVADATGCGVFAWSREGYGRSESVAPPWPLDYMEQEATACLPAVLDVIGVKKAILLGHSDGATIAAIHAGTVSDGRVRGLILMAPHFFAEPGGQAAIEATRAAFETGSLRERLARYHQDADNTFQGWSGVWLAPRFAAWNVTDAIDHFRIPTLAIQGRQDKYGTLAHIHALEDRSPGPVETVVIDNCHHAPHLEQPVVTLKVIRSFVETLLAMERAGAGPGAP